MRHIHRAAVTGLFAIWLAPLSAQVAAQPAAGSSAGSPARSAPIEARMTDDRTARRTPSPERDGSGRDDEA